jgi:hypothetical protein
VTPAPQTLNLTAFIVGSDDPHQSEYVAQVPSIRCSTKPKTPTKYWGCFPPDLQRKVSQFFSF